MGTVDRGSAGAPAALPAFHCGLLGRLLGRLRRPPPGLRSGGPRLRGGLVQGQCNSGRILEHREPAHSRTLGLRHYYRTTGGLDLLERAIDVFASDVALDDGGRVLSLLYDATGT